MKSFARLIIFVLAWAWPALAAAQEPLTQVKELYNAASYSEALSALSQVSDTADMVDVEKYRALCLLALGRTREAEQSLQTLALNRPAYSFDLTDASPRLVNLYQEVRKRTLPEAIKLIYQRARVSFDNGNMTDAARQFREVIELADAAPAEHAALMGELKMLASGFVRLAESPETPTAPASTIPSRSSASAVNPGIAVPPAAMIYDLSSTDVSPPVSRSRTVPQWTRPPALRRMSYNGTMELVIAVDGSVASARMIVPTHSLYDSMLLSAARRWRFDPARLAGQPVKYRLAYPISIASVGPQ